MGVELARDPDSEGDLRGGTPQENAAVTREILHGEPPPGGRAARRDLAVINAGAAIYTAGRADSIAAGVLAAREAVADGRAARALERYLQATLSYAPAQASP